MPQHARRVLDDAQVHRDISAVTAFCDDGFVVVRGAEERVADTEEVGEAPVCFTRVEAMTCGLVFFDGGVGGVPDGDGELGADVPVWWGVVGGDGFDVGGCVFFLRVSPCKV